MTTFKDYVFSKSAATRITGKKVFQLHSYPRCGWFQAVFEDGTTKILYLQDFKEHFAEYRRQQAKGLNPWLSPTDDSLWHVSKYRVAVYPDRLTCNCKDWQMQSAIGLKKPTCKHCYSVLNKLGCNSLAEYLEKNSEARESVKATNQTSETTRQNLTSSVTPKLPKINRWEWTWETYARDRAGNPLETVVSYSNFRPTEKEILENRKFNHSKGFRLVAIKREHPVTA
jgi:hypothetical protein